MAKPSNIYDQALALAEQIELELKQMGRWQTGPLPPECFEDMGAFGSKKMSFEQWIQFILLPTVSDIVRDNGEFPTESNLAAYAVRYFDGDTSVDRLHDLLYALDDLIDGESHPKKEPVLPYTPAGPYQPVITGNKLPEVVYTLIEVLPQFKGPDLESQLQTFDAFLDMLTVEVRPELVSLLRGAAAKVTDPESRKRIEQAATSIENGGRAAPPYNHTEAMKKYRDEFRKGYETN